MLQTFENNIHRMPKELHYSRVLEYFEGDLLTEYRVDSGGFYIEKWCDFSDGLNRYLVVKSDMRSIAEYLARKITMTALLNNNSDGFGFIIDRDAMNETVAVYRVLLENLNSKYLPNRDALHNTKLQPDWDDVPMSYLVNEEWDARLFADLEKKITTAAGFAYYTNIDNDRTLPQNVLNYLYDSGWSYGKYNDRLQLAIPPEERAETVGLQAASPGVLTINTPIKTFEQIRRSLERVGEAKDFARVVASWSRYRMEDHSLLPVSAFTELSMLCDVLAVRVASLFPAVDNFRGDPTRDTIKILTAGKLVVKYYRDLNKLVKPGVGVELILLNPNNSDG